tara:strand:+ start:1881 stop:2036 length:156 start_codon:yes stop_codon:yes gene_type:complete
MKEKENYYLKRKIKKLFPSLKSNETMSVRGKECKMFKHKSQRNEKRSERSK